MSSVREFPVVEEERLSASPRQGEIRLLFAVAAQRFPPGGGADQPLLRLRARAFVALLFDITPLLGLNTLLLLVGMLIYLSRFGARLLGAGWLERSSERFFAASALFLVVNIGLTIFLTIGLVSGLFTTANLPGGVLLAMDHSMFIGVMTNALFGLIAAALEGRPALRSWASDVIFWGTNVGLAGFLAGLITQTTLLYRLFTPLMGLGILVAIGLYAWLLVQSAGTRDAAQEAAPAA